MPERILEVAISIITIGINGMMFAVICEAIDKKGDLILDKIIKGIKND